jgi:nucleotide-binding universal stress UspA family protein
MMNRISVPLDGSTRAERAVPVAAAIARANDASLLLFRVVDISREVGSYGLVPSPMLGALVHKLRTTAETYVAECARSEMLQGLKVETLVEVGDAPDSILVHSEAWRADLLVICSHGRTGLARWALGSVAEHVSRHSKVPVLMLRDSGPSPAGRDADPERVLRVLVALDGSRYAEASLELAAELMKALAAPQKGTLHLAVVLSPFAADPANMPDAFALEGAKSYLERIANQLREAHCGISVTWSIAIELDIAEALIRIAQNGENAAGAESVGACDLIAMTTHGAGGIARWVMGSVTDRVLHATTLPMLIVRPAEATSR